MISGYKFIKQLEKEGLRGQFFSYDEYKAIGKIHNYDKLRSYVHECGFDYTAEAKNEKELVEVIKGQKEGKWTVFYMFEAPFWVILSLGSCS